MTIFNKIIIYSSYWFIYIISSVFSGNPGCGLGKYHPRGWKSGIKKSHHRHWVGFCWTRPQGGTLEGTEVAPTPVTGFHPLPCMTPFQLREPTTSWRVLKPGYLELSSTEKIILQALGRAPSEGSVQKQRWESVGIAFVL